MSEFLGAGHGGPRVSDAGIALAHQLRLIAGGDRVAYEELYGRVAPLLLAACQRIVSDPAEAEEAFQDAFLAIWHNAALFDPAKGSAVGWMLALARNRAIDRTRMAAKHQSVPLAAAHRVQDTAPAAGDDIERSQESERLAACMALLAAQDLRLIRAAFLQGARYAELSSQEDLPVGTIKTRVRRALLKLRECLQ